jgi:hypothetical protein
MAHFDRQCNCLRQSSLRRESPVPKEGSFQEASHRQCSRLVWHSYAVRLRQRTREQGRTHAQARLHRIGGVADQAIGRYTYRLSEVQQFFGAPILEAGLSLRQVSDLTGWKNESVCHWIAEGFLQAETIILRGQSCNVVTPVQMLAFCRMYMPLTDVAKLIDSRPSAVARRLEGIEVVGAKPLPDGARRGGLVRLADLAAHALCPSSK